MKNRETRNTIRTSLPYAGIFALALIQPSCTGTEADNPFTDPATTTLCKGDEGYVPLTSQREPLALDQDLFGSPVPALPAPPSGPEPHRSQLSSLSEIPVWLECLEWDYREGIFDYQLANFRGGCAVEWTGGGEITNDGGILVELQNESCAVAGCGSCLYDLRSNGQLETDALKERMTFDLIRRDCEGEATLESSWSLPIAEEPRGLLCREADRWGAEKSANNTESDVKIELYAPCDAGTDEGFEPRTCADNFTCIAGHCVPSCESDDDCPLSGALTCQDGYCQLPQ